MRKGFSKKKNSHHQKQHTPVRKNRSPRRQSTRGKLPRTAAMSRDLSVKHDPCSLWMILELNDDGECLYDRYELLESEILRVFGDEVEFFIPSYIEKINKDKIVGLDLIGGYIFVERTASSESAVASMYSPYIKRRMVEGGRSGPTTGAHINAYKKELLESIKRLAPSKGMMIVPKVGTFKNLEGKVLSVARDKKSARVVFKKSSRIVQAPVSVLNMEPLQNQK